MRIFIQAVEGGDVKVGQHQITTFYDVTFGLRVRMASNPANFISVQDRQSRTASNPEFFTFEPQLYRPFR